MNREQMVEKAHLALLDARSTDPDGSNLSDARAVLEAILPQVTTVAELEALHPRAQVMGRFGHVGRAGSVMASETVKNGGVLTVVWQPEVTA